MQTKTPWRKVGWIAFLALMLPAFALAQQTGQSAVDYEPAAGDFTTYMLHQIFGDWNNDGLAPLLGASMRVLNLFALTFGTLMFTYMTVVGTLNSAQDGEVLGKKWSSMWVPIRFTIGTGLLVPLSTGYSAAQHAVLWLALVGGGAASTIWSAAMEQFSSPMAVTSMVTKGLDYENKTRVLARQFLQAEVCTAMHAQSQMNGNFGRSTTQLGIPPSILNAAGHTPLPVYYIGGTLLQWGSVGDSDKPVDFCGSMTTPTFRVMANGDNKFAGVVLAQAPEALVPAFTALAKAQERSIAVNIPQVMGSFAKELANDPASKSKQDVTDMVNKLAAQYRGDTAGPIESLVQGSTSQLTDFIKNSSTGQGWMMASSSFFQMARIRSQAQAVISQVPSFTSGPSGENEKFALPGVTDGPLTENLNAANTRVQAALNEQPDSWRNLGERIARMVGAAFSFDPASPDLAIVQIKDKGDTLLVGIEVIATTALTLVSIQGGANSTIAGVVTNLVSGIGAGLATAVQYLAPAAYLGFIAMFGVAVTMAFLIPTLPFIISIGSILGWLMAVASAVVATPIWIAGHLHPEGDGFAGRGVGGYMILLETVTRPIFMICGLLMAFAIMDPMLKFMSWSYVALMSSVQGDSFTGLVSIVVYAMIYCSLVLTIIRTSLSLINSLQEKVYTWIGGQFAGYDQAGQFSQAAQSTTSAGVRGLQGAGGAVMGTAKNKLKERIQTRKDNAAATRDKPGAEENSSAQEHQ